MEKVFEALRLWCAERNVSTDGLTVIFNFQDARSGAEFDAYLRRDLQGWAYKFVPQADYDLSKFEMLGIKAKIESPVHTAVT